MPLNNQICPPFFKFQEVWLTYNPLETSAGFLKPNEMHHAVQNVETLPEQRSVMNDTHSSLWTRYIIPHQQHEQRLKVGSLVQTVIENNMQIFLDSRWYYTTLRG